MEEVYSIFLGLCLACRILPLPTEPSLFNERIHPPLSLSLFYITCAYSELRTELPTTRAGQNVH